MRKTNLLKKVFSGTVAAILVGTTLPASGYAGTGAEPAVSAHQMVQDIFTRVGLEMPSTQSDTGSSDSQNSTQNQPQNNGGSQTETPAVTENTQPSNNNSQPTDNQSSSQQSSLSQAEFGERIIKTGEKYLGTPYKYGARSGQTANFDCSSFVQYVFGQNGVKLPRTSVQQSYVGKEVSRSQLQKGDLVFFKLSNSNGRIAHVGIYAGDGKVLHTWGPGGVRYDNMSDRWLDWGFVKATRISPPNK